MREALFLKRNRERWEACEKQPAADPDELAERFIRLTDDLSYARTFYPGSRTVSYLNGLTSRLRLQIYRSKRERGSRFTDFWKRELPLVMSRNLRMLAYSAALFCCFIAVGAFSAHQDETFVRLILGDGYVEMTRENIAKGDPFGVYKNDDSFAMFVQIAFNNIFVTFRTFVMGLLAGVGTVVILLYNGVMLGAFEYMFFDHGLGIESLLVVFIHGTLEISAIIVAGAAGMLLGASILFPGTYTRRQSVMRGVREGTKIVIGLVPVFLVAALFEGYVTRYTGMPLLLSISILGGSLYFMLTYFVLLPLRLLRSRSRGQAVHTSPRTQDEKDA